MKNNLDYVVDFNEIDKKNVQQVGNKAANLSDLKIIADIKIPNGFCVTTKLYDEYISSLSIDNLLNKLTTLSIKWKLINDCKEKIELVKEIEYIAKEIRTNIQCGEFKSDYKAKIDIYYKKLGNPIVAVRSSCVAEDMNNASFAGQYKSVLGCKGIIEIIKSIKKVWSSNFELNPILYRNELTIDHKVSKMGVFVLEMVDAQSAGTVFTFDLETGNPQMITINNSYGLGEPVVKGDISPDTWIIDKQNCNILKRRLGDKQYRLKYNAELQEFVKVENKAEMKNNFSINVEAVKKLSKYVLQIQDYIKSNNHEIRAIDIEYAFDKKDGALYILQTRAETALSTQSSVLKTIDQKKLVKDYPIILEGGMTGFFGVTSGTLKVVTDVSDAEKRIQPGDIMAAPNTVSCWEQSMGISGGMITEIGGLGSHTAVIAREKHIPAILGANDAMAILQPYDGQIVTLDALFRRVYLGKILNSYIVDAQNIPAVYGSLDTVTEEEHWKGATAGGQTRVAKDGSKWIGKPNEKTSFFLNVIHDASHDWVAKALDLTFVQDKIEDGVYQVLFSDIHKWREIIRTRELEELEIIYEIWAEIIEDYLSNSQKLNLDRNSIEQWINSFVAVNGIMNVVFPLNEVISGHKEHLLKKKKLEEPYLSLSRLTIGADYSATLFNESEQELHSIYIKLSPEIKAFLSSLTEINEESVCEISRNYPKFYDLLMNYTKDYRITNEFALSMNAKEPINKAIEKIMTFAKGFEYHEHYKQCPEEFFPEDLKFNRFMQLATVSNKLKQDSHHLKFRGQWKFIEVIEPFVEYLIESGIVSTEEDVFKQSHSWMIQHLEQFISQKNHTIRKPLKKYNFKSYVMPHLESKDWINNKWGRLLMELKQNKITPVSISNIIYCYKQAVQRLKNIYPKSKKIIDESNIAFAEKKNRTDYLFDNHIVLTKEMLINEDIIFQEILRQLETKILNIKSKNEIHILEVATNFEEVITLFSFDKVRRAKYLNDATNVFSREKERFEFYKHIKYLFLTNIDEIKIFQKILLYLGEQDNMPITLINRLSQIFPHVLDNLSFLKVHNFGDRNIYPILLAESETSGVSVFVILSGLISLNKKSHIVDNLLLKRRWQFDLDNTQIDYVFIGGGGFNAGTINRSIKWIREDELFSITNSNNYIGANIVTTWDRGGSSQKDADAVRNRFKKHVISPGDIMTVLSFQSITDKRWFQSDNIEDLISSSDYKPENFDAVMDLLYSYKNRLTVPRNTTLKKIVEERVIKVNADNNLSKPDNWFGFIINLRKAAEIIDKELIEQGYIDEIRQQHTSVQNLLLMALIVAFNMDQNRASHEILHILGLNNIFALPASFEDAVQSMKVQDPNGYVKDEIIGHLNVANVNESYIFNEGDQQYIGKPYKWVLKESEDIDSGRVIKDLLPEEFPKANSDVVTVIKNCQRAVVMGMSSPFDSTLSNLMLTEIVDSIKAKVKEGVPSIYFPKIITELQIEQLNLKEIFEILERSIQSSQNNFEFQIQQILTHVFIPKVPEQIWDVYLEKLKKIKGHILTGEGKQKLDKLTIKSVDVFKKARAIFANRDYWNEDTKIKIHDGWYKIAKLIPGEPFVFSHNDIEFFKNRGIIILNVSDSDHYKLYRIWEERGVYNTNHIARILDQIEKNYC